MINQPPVQYKGEDLEAERRRVRHEHGTVLLLITGQTIIFLLRLVAADRRSRRRPLASGSKTVGELDDERSAAPESDADGLAADHPTEPPSDEEPVRQ